MSLTCLAVQGFCMTKGQDLIITVPVVDAEGVAVNLDDAEIIFGIARSNRSEYLITMPTTTDENIITATLSVEDSNELTPQKYYFSCWVDIGVGQTPVARGTISVESDPRSS